MYTFCLCCTTEKANNMKNSEFMQWASTPTGKIKCNEVSCPIFITPVPASWRAENLRVLKTEQGLAENCVFLEQRL